MENDISGSIDGVWILRSLSTCFPDGRTERHDGAAGELIYSAGLKTVFAHILRPDDRSLSGVMHFEYAGSFDITGPGRIVHHIAWATSPAMTGLDLRREFSLSADGTRLFITGPSAEYRDATARLEWIKLAR